MRKNTFGFLVPIYEKDQPKVLESCLKSIVDQSRYPDEIILVCEGLIDQSLKNTITFFSKNYENFLVIDIPKQVGPLGFGLPASLNIGLIESKSDYIVRLDSDDYSIPSRLEKIESLVNKNPHLELIGSNILEFDEYLMKASKARNVPETHAQIKSFSKWRNPFNGPAVTFKRQTALKLGGYPLVGSNEDYCLWASFLKYNIPSYNIQENLVYMRAGDAIISRRGSIRYLKGEIQSTKYLYGIGFYSFLEFIIHIIIRSIIRLLPNKYIKFIYNSVLRT